MKSIFCIGDSLTDYGTKPKGWVNLLQEYYKQNATTAAVGKPGWMACQFWDWMKSQDYKNREPKTIDYLTIDFGTNDAALGYGDSTIDIMIQSYNNLLNYYYSFTQNLYVMLPPPAHVRSNNVSPERHFLFTNAIKHWCVTNKVPFLDLYPIITEDRQIDGIHFNDEGNRLVFEGMRDLIVFLVAVVVCVVILIQRRRSQKKADYMQLI